jgi:hypothetical protein
MSECGMSEYATYYCYDCSRRMPRTELHRDTIEIQSGRSSGGVGFGLRGFRLYSGRTYYRKKEIWLCDNCYQARSRPWWSPAPKRAPKPAPTPAVSADSKFFAALQDEMGKSERGSFATAAVLGGVAILLIVMLPVFFRGNSTDAAKPQAVDRTAVVAPLQDANKLNAPSVIMTAQNRLIELGFLAGPADGVWGTKSRAALRAFKIANGLAADDKWDDLVSGRLYSTRAVRSPLPLATTGR